MKNFDHKLVVLLELTIKMLRNHTQHRKPVICLSNCQSLCFGE